MTDTRATPPGGGEDGAVDGLKRWLVTTGAKPNPDCDHEWTTTGFEGPAIKLPEDPRTQRPRWPLLWRCDSCGQLLLQTDDGRVALYAHAARASPTPQETVDDLQRRARDMTESARGTAAAEMDSGHLPSPTVPEGVADAALVREALDVLVNREWSDGTWMTRGEAEHVAVSTLRRALTAPPTREPDGWRRDWKEPGDAEWRRGDMFWRGPTRPTPDDIPVRDHECLRPVYVAAPPTQTDDHGDGR